MIYKKFLEKIKELHKLQMKLMDKDIHKDFEKFAKSIGISKISCGNILFSLTKEIKIDGENFSLELRLYGTDVSLRITSKDMDELFYVKNLHDEMNTKGFDICKGLYEKYNIESLILKAKYLLKEFDMKKINLKQKLINFLCS